MGRVMHRHLHLLYAALPKSLNIAIRRMSPILHSFSRLRSTGEW